MKKTTAIILTNQATVASDTSVTNNHKIMSPFKTHQKLLFLISIIFLSFSSSALYAQQSVTSAGGDGESSQGSISFSSGLVAYTAAESPVDDAMITQGVQHPFESFEFDTCPTDFNNDGTTDGDDFSIFLGNYNFNCDGSLCPTDLNGDGITDGDDFSIYLGNYGLDCPGTE